MESTPCPAPPPISGDILEWLAERLRGVQPARLSWTPAAPVEVQPAVNMSRAARARHIDLICQMRALLGSKPSRADQDDANALDAAIAALSATPSLEDAEELAAWRALGAAWRGQVCRLTHPTQEPPSLVQVHWPDDVRLIGAALALALGQRPSAADAESAGGGQG